MSSPADASTSSITGTPSSTWSASSSPAAATSRTPIIDDFAYEIRTFGHIPNGNRSYYLSRSQPPFFATMLALVARRRGAGVFRQ